MNQHKGNKGGFGNFKSGGNRFGGRNSGRDGGNFRRDSFSGPREMHKATCSDCKQECEVPFKPIEGKPVYCKDCYPRHKKF